MAKIVAFLSSILLSLTSLFGGLPGCGGSDISDEWKEMVLNNYNEFIAEVEADEDLIPMIVHTDQHGAIDADSELYKYIDSIVDWSKISKIINLGDTVEQIFNVTDLLAYTTATACLPAEKRIEVIGNHDRFFVQAGAAKMIDKTFFPTLDAVRSEERNTFVVKDEQFNVRYLAVDTKHFPWNYQDGSLSSSQADYIIKELEKADDSDIIMLSHQYIFRDAVIRRNGQTFTGSEYFIGGPEKDADVKQSFIDMLSARKNKTSGVLLDSAGKKHPYDFSACTSDLLMTLHGHHHSEGYETSNGITEFLFQSMTLDNAKNTEPQVFYFCYINRATKTFKCWKNFEGYDAWEFSIA